METVEQEQDARPRHELPPGVQDALGELAGAAKDGLLALSVGVGLGVLSEMMEAELDEVVGPKYANNAQRTAVRHGHEDGEVTLGGRRVAVRRPRARSADDEHEVPLQTYAYFADRDPLTRVVLEQMLAGVGPDHGILLRFDHQNSPPWVGRRPARGVRRRRVP
jgi:putative transposase